MSDDLVLGCLVNLELVDLVATWSISILIEEHGVSSDAWPGGGINMINDRIKKIPLSLNLSLSL